MTPDNESISVVRAAAPKAPAKAKPARRRVSSVVAGLAVIGFSAALIAPTGVAIAEPPPVDEPVSMFSLAAEDTQNLTVTVEGGSIEPIARAGFEVYVKPKPKPKPPPEPAATKKSTASDGAKRPSAPSRPKYTGGGSKEDWMAAAGIAQSDWAFVDYIVSKESGWNPNATNPSSGACGLVQALPCSKVPGNGYNPVDNLRWGNGYALGRYGSWEGAYAFWTRNHWW